MSQPKQPQQPTPLPPFNGHWTMYVNKTGLTLADPSEVPRYNDLQQTFYAGGLAMLALLETRGQNLQSVDDVVAEMVQFARSQGTLPEEQEATDQSAPEIQEAAIKLVDPVKEAAEIAALAEHTGLDDLEKL